jgi:UDP-N-acetylglucosamine acyltransferase
MIDKMAIVDPTAIIAEDVVVGPYTVIGPNVEIDKGTWIGPNVVIPCNTKIGKNNKIYQFASIGGDNQDLVFDDKPTYLEIGDNNIIHEFVTINRGSVKESCLTKIQDNNLIMAYSHIGHDCEIGSHTIFANGATLAGHVLVENFATIGAYCAVHQFCNIGEYSFIARGAMVTKDVLPYVLVSGNNPEAHGLNKVGLERNGFTKESIRKLLKAYKLIFRTQSTLQQTESELVKLATDCQYTQKLYQAIQRATRGFIR